MTTEERILRAEQDIDRAKKRLAEAKRNAQKERRAEENRHKYMMGGIVHRFFTECYNFDEQELYLR